MTVQRMDNVGIVVGDLDAAVVFFTELGQYQSPVAQPGPHNPPHNIVGTHRVMFTVDDIDEVLTRLRPYGGEVVGTVVQFQDTYKLCYVRGPEGIILGLAQQLT